MDVVEGGKLERTTPPSDGFAPGGLPRRRAVTGIAERSDAAARSNG